MHIRDRILHEQFSEPTYVAKRGRVPLGEIIDGVRKGVNEAQHRLQMLKVHVEIAMMGQDRELIEKMIKKGEAMVCMWHDQSGTYGAKRAKLISEMHSKREKECEMDRLAEVERLSDIRRLTREEKEHYREQMHAWIRLIEKKHHVDETVAATRMKRQRQAEWTNELNRRPKLKAAVSFNHDQTSEQEGQEAPSIVYGSATTAREAMEIDFEPYGAGDN